LACVFLVLILCVFAPQPQPSTGILIPMMHARSEPLSNCSFAGFTIYLRSDGTLGGGSRDQSVSWEEMLSRVRDAQDNIRDNTFFVIGDQDVPYGYVFKLTTDIRAIAPTAQIALVTSAGQVSGINGRGPYPDRCQYVWPAVTGQPEKPIDRPQPLPRVSIWQALLNRK
jgi:biopolymer transport protein ExbD